MVGRASLEHRRVGFLNGGWVFAAWGALAPLGVGADTLITISGGDKATSNICEFYDELGVVDRRFPSPRWTRLTFVADGKGKTPNSMACDAEGVTKRDIAGRPELSRRDPAGGVSGGARREEIEEQLRARAKRLKPGESVVFYVTDHGSPGDGRKDRRIVLWGEELTVDQFRDVIALLPESNRVVLLQDHCYSGGMLDAIWGKDGTPRRNTCGIASSSTDELSSTSAGIIRSVDQLAKQGKPFGADDVLGAIRSDPMNEALPIASSELFLARYLEKVAVKHRVAEQNRVLSDCLLAPGGLNEVARGLDGAARALLEEKRVRLFEELKAAYRAAGLEAGTPYDRLRELSETNRILVDALEDRMTMRGQQRSQAILEWMQKKHPDITEKYDEAKSQLETLRARYSATTVTDVSERAKLRLQIETASSDFEQASGAFQRYRDAAKSGHSPEFDRFASSHGGAPPKAYPRDILTRFDRAGDDLDKAVAEGRSFRRLHRAVGEFNALKALASSGDTARVAQYLDLLSCESQRLGP